MILGRGLRLQSTALVVLGLFLLFYGGFQAVQPFVRAIASINATNARIQTFAKTVDSPRETVAPDLSGLVAADTSSQEYERRIQRLLRDVAVEHGLQVQRLSAYGLEANSFDMRAMTFDLQMTGDLAHWSRFLESMSEVRPILFLKSAEASASTGPRPDVGMRLSLQLVAYVDGAGSGE